MKFAMCLEEEVTNKWHLAPQMGEYARTNTAVVNAFLWNTIDAYVSGLNRRLGAMGLPNDVMVMQANGGIVRPAQMTGVGTLQSGPAGGMIATAYVAKVLGHPNVITGDMGGTSFDVGLLTDHRLSHAREPIAERFRLLQPMINVESIGAGGGTIARIDPVTGRLLVGPESAGADPGPIVYGMGGQHVTITDCNVVLGYIDPDYFLGGRRKLDKRAAEAAIEAIERECQDIRARPPVLAVDLKAEAGMVLVLSRDGTPTLQPAFYGERQAEAPGDDDALEIVAGEGGQGLRRAALSKRLVDELAMQRRDVLALHVASDPALALDLMVFPLADADTASRV